MATQRLDLPTLVSTYGSEESCRGLLESIRWPNGIACTKCGSLRVNRVTGRDTFRCLDCAMHFSVRAGTVLQDSKLPLSTWLLGTYLICEAKKGISSNQLKRMLGVSYKTSWFLTHRVRGAMGQLHHVQLSGVVEADETFHGGKPRHMRYNPDGSIAQGPNPDKPKPIVLGVVSRGGEVRFKVTTNRTGQTIRAFLDAEVSDGASAIYTDEFGGYYGIGDENTKHETVNHKVKEYVRGDVHSNTIESVWSLFKRSVVGTHHQLSVKHLPAYLDEVAFKYNNRENTGIFRETLRVLVTADPLTYEALIAE